MASTQQVPIVDYLRIGVRPYLRASECESCGARYFDRRNACARCGRVEFNNARVSNRGVLRSFSIVHRAAPGIPVPYVSALVETEDGTTVRSNIVDCPPDPEHVKLGMKVRLATYVAGTDDAGTECVAFGYRPV
ncbi:MAG: hypothetical protein MAG471_00871 [Acidimicrobiaceae bacterium]|nr:hypothetical protein [Acidimicrobiaceae bacterium]